jgi:glycerol dehydrogenase-like iron-containing ADH family enzyme
VLHGVQVGSACLFTLHLLGELTPAVLQFAEAMRIPFSWADLMNDRGQAAAVISRARVVRPERRTILDELSDEQILGELSDFGATCHEMLREQPVSIREAAERLGKGRPAVA